MRIDAFKIGAALLRQGDFANGWKLYETRPHPPLPFLAAVPRWEGEHVSSLLVVGEQGLGDQIMFARFLRQIRERGTRVTLLVMAPLSRLLAPLVDDVVVWTPALRLPRPDAWAFIGSLPRILGVTLETLSGAAYLPGLAGGSGIGVMSRGNPRHGNDHRRSLSGDDETRLLSLPGARSLAPHETGAQDLEDTRRLIAQLGLVISVDTAVAHLAGAMGKPCWLLLDHDPDWRWFDGRGDSPWYDSVRLFRQSRPAVWQDVLAEVSDELALRWPA